MNILVIEDDRLTLGAMQYCIQSLGHSATVAGDGREAIELISSNTFDLLITDIMMPGISGLSLVNEIRSTYGIKTPIIMMSSLSHVPLLEAAFEAGADDFIAKPFTTMDLEDKLKKFDQQKRK